MPRDMTADRGFLTMTWKPPVSEHVYVLDVTGRAGHKAGRHAETVSFGRGGRRCRLLRGRVGQSSSKAAPISSEISTLV